ncbi:MAG: PadR family transcriptional regulator, partial [Clostridium sp.]|nr:PadR family transcriptional regulator [Clostridium sp.]
LDQHNQRLAFLYTQQERYESVPEITSPEFGDYVVLDGAIIREKATIEWLSHCIEYSKNS